MHISGESLYNKTNEMLHAFGGNRMTHQFPICEYQYQLKLMADIAQMHIRGKSLKNKTNEMLHAFGTNRMTQQFPICE